MMFFRSAIKFSGSKGKTGTRKQSFSNGLIVSVFFRLKLISVTKAGKKLVFNDELLDILGQEDPDQNNPKDREIAMNQCLGKLDTQDRSLLLERYQGELSVDQLAQREGISPNTLSQKLLRLRHQLLICIQANLKTI